MSERVKPSGPMFLIGGVGMIIASFLRWKPTPELLIDGNAQVELGRNGWELGMLGLWQTIIGAVVAAIGVLVLIQRTDVLPQDVFGFSLKHAVVVLAMPVLLWNFGLQFDQVYGGIGLLVGWVAAALAMGATALD